MNSWHGKVSCKLGWKITFSVIYCNLGFAPNLHVWIRVILCRFFINRYPDRFVSPLRVSGSAVESLFGQYKRSTGRKLDAANYTVSRAAQLVK